MTKINNIILTPLPKCFREKAINFFIGPWCENSDLKKFNYEIIPTTKDDLEKGLQIIRKDKLLKKNYEKY